MSLLERLNPRRIIRAADAVPRLQEVADRLRDDHKTLVRQLRRITQQLEQVERALDRQQEILACMPELQNQVQRCATAYTSDVRTADLVRSLRDRPGEGERLSAHAREAVARARLEREPFPYVLVENLLPEDAFDELVRALPAPLFFTQEARREELKVPFFFAPEYARTVWGLFFEDVITQTMIPALTEKFGPTLDEFVREHWPELGSMQQAGIRLCVSNSRLLLRRPGYVIQPHRDPRWAFLTCLVYLPRPSDTQSYGTQLYRIRNEPVMTHTSPLWVDPSDCELARDVPARRNTALVFLNSVGAHGASIPEDAPSGTERYLYQVQFGVDAETRQKLIDSLEDPARASWVTERVRGYQ